MKGTDVDGCTEYTIIKARLLRAAGVTIKQAGKKQFSDRNAFIRSLFNDKWRQAKSLFARILESNYTELRG